MGLFDRFFRQDAATVPASEIARPTAFELNRLAWIVTEERYADNRVIPATDFMVSNTEAALRANNVTRDETTAAVRLAVSLAHRDFIENDRERPIGNPFTNDELRKAYDDRCELLDAFEEADRSALEWSNGDARDLARNHVGYAEHQINRSEADFESARLVLTEAIELELENGGHAIRDALAKLEQYEPSYSRLSQAGIVSTDHRSTYDGPILGVSDNSAFQEANGQIVAHLLRILHVGPDTPTGVRESLLDHGSNVRISYPMNGIGHIKPLSKHFQPTVLEPLVAARQMKENSTSSANLSSARTSRGMKL